MIVPVQKKRVYEDISEQIQKQIEEGIWKEGDRMPGEIELANLFQVSRGSIREAIKSLQMMGVLEAKSGQGTYVSSNALQKIQDNRLTSMISDIQYRDQVLECRYMIEPQAAFVAAQICTEKDIEYLKDSYRQMLACSEEGDVAGMNQWGNRFHSYIVDMVDNEVLSAIYKSIEQQILDDLEEFVNESGSSVMLSYHEEHLALIEAFEEHDPVLARKILDIHLGRKLKWKRK